MATRAWDRVPVYGWFQKADGTPDPATVTFDIVGAPNGVKRADGRAIYRAGASLTVKSGEDTAQDPAVRNRIRAAMRNRDQVVVEALGQVFDGTAWDVAWDAAVPSMICTSFYAQDDADITPQGWRIQVTEKVSGRTTTYPITLTLAMIDAAPVPGLNLADVEIPPGTVSRPDPSYAKGQPGGVASLDGTGRVPLTQLPAGLGSGGGGGSAELTSYEEVSGLADYPDSFPPGAHMHTAADLTDSTGVGRDLLRAGTSAAARAAIDAAAVTHTHPISAIGGLAARLEELANDSGGAPADHTHLAADITDLATALRDFIRSVSWLGVVIHGNGARRFPGSTVGVPDTTTVLWVNPTRPANYRTGRDLWFGYEEL